MPVRKGLRAVGAFAAKFWVDGVDFYPSLKLEKDLTISSRHFIRIIRKDMDDRLSSIIYDAYLNLPFHESREFPIFFSKLIHLIGFISL